jgi:diadenosine tetraphosphate (Ap4A) HIT family hydrolase
MEELPIPPQEAIIFSDEKLYVCLASYPLTKGHVVIVWKDSTTDLHSLARAEYEYLMDAVDIARNSLLEKYAVEKVYLLYLDEVNHVHWHLVPRYEEKGFNILNHAPKKTDDFGDTKELSQIFLQKRSSYK